MHFCMGRIISRTCSGVPINPAFSAETKYIIRRAITEEKQHGCAVPVSIWSIVTDPAYQTESLSVMVTELKEDHQHRASIKAEKSKTSSHKGTPEKRPLPR